MTVDRRLCEVGGNQHGDPQPGRFANRDLARLELQPSLVELIAALEERLAERPMVLVVEDGAGGLRQARAMRPDLIVLDIIMPGMDGFELAAHIRNREHLMDLPIVMVTSRTGEKHRQRAARLGVQEYLGKPYREEELLAAFGRVLGERAEGFLIKGG